jgi:hypothetical protein
MRRSGHGRRGGDAGGITATAKDPSMAGADTQDRQVHLCGASRVMMWSSPEKVVPGWWSRSAERLRRGDSQELARRPPRSPRGALDRLDDVHYVVRWAIAP